MGGSGDPDGLLGPYPCPIDISRQKDFLLVDKRFPDGGFRRAVIVAPSPDACNRIECGSSPKCVHLCASGLWKKLKTPPPPSPEEKLLLSRKRSARAVSDLVRASGLDHLLTLSAGKHFRSRLQALDAWSGFLHDHRDGRWFNDLIEGKYVAIAEPYEDLDGWHLHIALSGWIRPPHLMRLKISWTRYLYSRLSIPRPSDTAKRLWRVHIAAPGKNRSPRALGRYLAKYITKSFDNAADLGERRYRAGQGLKRPTVSRLVVRFNDSDLRKLFAGCGRIFEVLDASGRHMGWAAEGTGSGDIPEAFIVGPWETNGPPGVQP